MPRTRIKFCGITRPEDARAAAQAGADAIGLVFHPASPRAVTVEQALAVMAALPAFVTTVGLFVDAPAEEVRSLLSKVPLDLLQFHGDESPAYCQAFARPWFKAIRMRAEVDLHEECRRHAGARALLVDAFHPDRPGGTGETFDWERIPGDLPLPLILAGGLTPDNVADAVRRVRPWAVDVSGGVEERAPDGAILHGHKSAQAMQAFARGVNSV